MHLNAQTLSSSVDATTFRRRSGGLEILEGTKLDHPSNKPGMEMDFQRQGLQRQSGLYQVPENAISMGHSGKQRHRSADFGRSGLRSGGVCGIGGACEPSALYKGDSKEHNNNDVPGSLTLDWLQQNNIKYRGRPASDAVDIYTSADLREWSAKMNCEFVEVVARFEDPEDGHDALLLCTSSGKYYLLHDYLFYSLGFGRPLVLQASLSSINSTQDNVSDPYHWRETCTANAARLEALHQQLYA